MMNWQQELREAARRTVGTWVWWAGYLTALLSVAVTLQLLKWLGFE